MPNNDLYLRSVIDTQQFSKTVYTLDAAFNLAYQTFDRIDTV